MEKTQRKQSLNCLSNTPKLFDLNELLSSLKITPGQMENMKGLIYIEGLTEKQVRQRLSHAKIIIVIDEHKEVRVAFKPYKSPEPEGL